MEPRRKSLPKIEMETAHEIFYDATGISNTTIDKALRLILLNYTAPKKLKEKLLVPKAVSRITGEEITYLNVTDAIKLFEPYLPQEFTESRPPYSIMANKIAVSKLLETTSFVDLNTMIQQYFVTRRSDEYRPMVGTILEFCTVKFTKIQDFLRPKNGGTRYSLANIPGEVRGEFNKKHQATLDRLTAEKERVNAEFQKSKLE